jgi:hypothetical protein
MTLALPQNVAPILKARMEGLRPAAMVIVSMVGPVRTEQPLVLIEQRTAYDWRWLRGLDVCLYVGDGDDWALTLKAIALARPANLSLWNSAGKWGAHVYLVPSPQDVVRPVPTWTYELDFLPWMDFQNDDFVMGRSYSRDPEGVPYAVDP